MDLSSSLDLLRATLAKEEAESKELERRIHAADNQTICTGDLCPTTWKPALAQIKIQEIEE